MAKLEVQYTDPRLVALYDLANARGADTDFYVQLAVELNAQRIIDLGCGTGLLTREFATPGREVLGVDPSFAMLANARSHPGAERVQWIEGDASAMGTPDADLVTMTGNVAQVFLTDDEWAVTLGAIHAALRPGGHLAFESRNPDDHSWERWNRAATYTRSDTPNGPMEEWLDVVTVRDGIVHFQAYNVFQATGEVLVVASELRFRTLAEFTASFAAAGFTIEQVYGGWQHEPLATTSRVMVFVARRT
jgi:SAM-dependent methyltransferase